MIDRRYERLLRDRGTLIERLTAAQTGEEKSRALALLHVLDEELKERGERAC